MTSWNYTPAGKQKYRRNIINERNRESFLTSSSPQSVWFHRPGRSTCYSLVAPAESNQMDMCECIGIGNGIVEVALRY
jgi:hypothetical protein